ncbi:MAG: hypothetical protein KGH49_00995 [Candidatus Micrarchaeota archaeon]|nr:hypothetical protein [Candidatus Micrarchaeota archaeon]
MERQGNFDSLMFNIPTILRLRSELRKESKVDRSDAELKVVAKASRRASAAKLVLAVIGPEFIQTLGLIRSKERMKASGIAKIGASMASGALIGCTAPVAITQVYNAITANSAPQPVLSDAIFAGSVIAQLAIHFAGKRGRKDTFK